MGVVSLPDPKSGIWDTQQFCIELQPAQKATKLREGKNG